MKRRKSLENCCRLNVKCPHRCRCRKLGPKLWALFWGMVEAFRDNASFEEVRRSCLSLFPNCHRVKSESPHPFALSWDQSKDSVDSATSVTMKMFKLWFQYQQNNVRERSI